ncbi:MAG: DUF58 domain-containing protein [Lachnospiraceae bacterium]|nr:DUF58 domain-containing protein [Lachnospiraceae bacterium]
MRRNRIILIILWILSLVGISFFGGTVSYGFFAAVTLVPAVSFIYLLLVFLRFKIYQRMDSRRVVADELSDFYITLQNEDYFAFTSIRMILYSGFSELEGIDGSAEYELMPRTGIKRDTRLLCRYRGEYEAGVKEVVIRDFLNLFSFTYRNPEPFRVTVLPKIVVLDSVKTVEESLGVMAETYSVAGEPDVVVREYQPGDDARMIHWRASAGKGKLLVRKTVGIEKQGISIAMEPGRYSDDPETYLPLENRICEIVIALTMYYLNVRTPVSVFMFQDELSVDRVRDTDGFNAFYTNISAYRFEERPDKQGRMAELLSGSSAVADSKILILVLYDICPETEKLIRSLGQSGVYVLVYIVNDNPEKDFTSLNLPRCMVHMTALDADLQEVL